MPTSKEIVQNYYNSDFANDPQVHKDFLHPDCKLHWSSSKGYRELSFEEISTLFQNVVTTYDSMRVEISHLLEDGDRVIARYTNYACLIENPEEEIPLAHFITIWELKDGLLYQGHEISQLADDSLESLKSFSEIKL